MVQQLFGVNIAPIEIAQFTPGVLTTIEGYEPASLVKEAIAWAIILAGVLCVVFICIGGISFILSGGQDEKIKQAVATIRYAIIGLVITFLSITMVDLVAFIFQIPFDFVDYPEILEKIRSLGQIFQQDSSFDGSDFDGF